jgi:hypothetical protein
MFIFSSRKHARARARSLARLVEGEGKGKERKGLDWPRTLRVFFSGHKRELCALFPHHATPKMFHQSSHKTKFSALMITGNIPRQVK